MSSRRRWLIAKIVSEGYCCFNGYLRLCKARGETPVAMAENINVSADTIWYHFRELEKGNRPCNRYPDCLNETIIEIEKNPPIKGD